MTKTSKGLGRGFDALIPQNFDSSLLAEERDRVQKLFIRDIIPAKEQPRSSFDETALGELAASIKRHGILQPIVVRRQDNDSYEIVAGERRWRAAQLAGLETVPAIVRTLEELERLEIALIENVQRVDLSPLDQAASILRLHDQFSMEYAMIAERLGKAVSTISNIARLVQLPPQAQQALHNNEITEGHARAILAFKDLKKQRELLGLIIKNGWNVRQAEQFVTAHKEGVKDTTKAALRTSSSSPETKMLGKILKAKVTLRRTAKGGKLEIAFKSDSDLKRIIQRLQG